MSNDLSNRPHTTVVLAMSADGKIADARRSPTQFGSSTDKAHLEAQVAQADGVLFGAGTLRAGGTAMRVTHPGLLEQRQQQGKPPQPVQIVCSRSAKIDPQLRFFRQSVPRWLLTTTLGAAQWQASPKGTSGFEQVLAIETVQPIHPEELPGSEYSIQGRQATPTQGGLAASPPWQNEPSDQGSANLDPEVDWIAAFNHFRALGLVQLVILGGGELVASLLSVGLIDEVWLTICPLLLGGTNAPTPVEGSGFLTNLAPRLELLTVRPVGQEVFLHYRLQG